MKTQILRYQTVQPVSECTRNILASPHKYECKWGSTLRYMLKYKVEMIDSSKMYITFCGGEFRKNMRTKYLAEFVSESSNTSVNLYFCSELFGLPPMTPISDIDLFMEQKIAAFRCTNR